MIVSSPTVPLRSIAETARSLFDSTRTLAEVHIHDLKAQVDDLWASAESLLPPAKRADLIAYVEKAVEEIRSWNAIGLRSGVAT